MSKRSIKESQTTDVIVDSEKKASEEPPAKKVKTGVSDSSASANPPPSSTQKKSIIVNHFDIYANDPQRCIDFYSYVFGWTAKQWEDKPYWMVTPSTDKSAGGICGGIMTRPKDTPMPSRESTDHCTFLTLTVDDLNAYSEKIEKKGGFIGKDTDLGFGITRKCWDSENNKFCLIWMRPPPPDAKENGDGSDKKDKGGEEDQKAD